MSTNPPGAILNQQHLAQIQGALSTVEYAKKQIALAKLAGIDVSAAETNLLASEAQLRQLKSVYFPGQ